MKKQAKISPTDYTFIKVWSTNMESTTKYYDNLDSSIPKEWQLVLTSDGSLTRHINILNQDTTQLNLIITTKMRIRFQNNWIVDLLSNSTTSKIKREVWLINNSQTLIFAQSYWLEDNLYSQFNSQKPIGQVFIDNELNVHRELTNIYYGYCKIIEAEFNASGPLWGRSYLVYFNRTPTVIINEIFSPYLVKDIKFFTNKTHA